jgi:hypothetical protein
MYVDTAKTPCDRAHPAGLEHQQRTGSGVHSDRRAFRPAVAAFAAPLAPLARWDFHKFLQFAS